MKRRIACLPFLACLACGSVNAGAVSDGGAVGQADAGTDGPAFPDAGPDADANRDAEAGAGNSILLVDNDGYVGDGSGTDATILGAYDGYLKGAGVTAFDTISIQADGSQSWGASALPSGTQLAAHQALIWMTADNPFQIDGSHDAPISTDQETALAGWLATGGKTLVIVSEDLISTYQTDQNVPGVSAWTTALTDPIFAKYLTIAGSDDHPEIYNQTDCVPISNQVDAQGNAIGFTVNGASGVSSSFAALKWTIDDAAPLKVMTPTFEGQTMNAGAGIDVLATTLSEEPGGGPCNSTNTANAIAVGKKNAGGTTSTVVYVGFEPYNIQNGAAQSFMTGILKTYAGLP